MSGSHPSRWLTFLVFGALTAFGCVGGTDTGQRGETGSLSVELVLAGGIEIDQVGWQITGNGMDMSGSIDVTAPGSTASVEVFGLPPGAMDYTVMLTATSNDEQVTCEGSAPFNVEVGQSTNVMVMLNCKKPRTLGGVRVNGKFNICTQLTKVVVSPLQTSVGNDISLSAQAFDEEGDDILYIWSGDGGSIADPSAASTTYTCQEVGQHTVTILVTDNDVYCRMATWTVPVTCVPGDVIDLCEDVECPPDGNQCTEAACEPSSGECVSSDLDDGTLCDIIGVGDGICSNGQCVEIDLCEGVDCDDDNECTADACNPADGTCENTNVDNGTTCADETGMCVDGACMISDLCEGVVCDDTGNECTVAMCNTATGICDTMNVTDGTECNSGAGACSAGVCIDDNPCAGVDCTSDNDCVQDGSCDPADGLCDPGDPQPADTACDLTGTDDGFCDGAGACVACNADAQCPDDGNECTAETCTSNACSSSPVADGTACDADGSAGVCMSGVCEDAMLCADAETRCSDGNECTQDLCDPATGECSNPAEPDGSQCTCPVCGAEGVCDMGVCIDPCDGVDCGDDNQCTADLCNVGVCSNPNVGPGAACDQDGGNVCDGSGSCVECNNDGQCDVGQSCIDGTCIAIATACNDGQPQQQVVGLGCSNSVTRAQSPFPWTLSVEVNQAIFAGQPFDVTFDGVGFFPELFLDIAQGTIAGGVKEAVLAGFTSTVQVRSGATGPDVQVPLDIGSVVPGPTRLCNFPTDQVCTADGDCLGAVCNPPVIVANIPIDEDCCAVGGGCGCDNIGKAAQCLSTGTVGDPNVGWCVTGPLIVQLEETFADTYTATNDSEVLFGWAERDVPDYFICPGAPGQDAPGGAGTADTRCASNGSGEPAAPDGTLAIPYASGLNPVEPIGIRVAIPPGSTQPLAVAIQCGQGIDGGRCGPGTGVAPLDTPGCLTDADCTVAPNTTCMGAGGACVGGADAGDPCYTDGNCTSGACDFTETADNDVILVAPDDALISCPIN